MEDRKALFRTLGQIADGISAMYGKNCEVVVHDISKPGESLVHIAGNVTGREVGAPATDLLLKELNKDHDAIHDIYNYKTTAKDGRSLKSTTMFIRNAENRIVAALCINLDTTDFFTAARTIASFLPDTVQSDREIKETFSVSASETIDAIFDQTLEILGKQPASMSTEERKQLIQLLNEQNVFDMKGAVQHVARLCGVSQFTIYNYLKITREKQQNHQEKSHEKSYSNG